MVEHDFEPIIQILKERIGSQWSGLEADGRDEMIGVLKDHLGYSQAEANAAIEALIDAGVVRYHRPIVNTDDEGIATPPASIGGAISVSSTTGSGGMAGIPLAMGIPLVGHWQIGRDGENSESDQGMAGRRGQVNPGS